MEEFNEEEKVLVDAVPQTPSKVKIKKERFSFSKPQKIFLMVVAVAIVCVLITALIIGLIPNRALNDDVFMGFKSVNIYDGSNFWLGSFGHDEDNENDKLLLEGLQSTQHSLLRSAFGFNYVNSLRLRTRNHTETFVEYDEDRRIIRDEITNEPLTRTETTVVRDERMRATQVSSQVSAQPGTYVLEFVFASQTDARHRIRVRDNTTAARDRGERHSYIYFDRIRIVINDSLNEIEEYVLFAYDSVAADISNPSISENQFAVPILIRMNTTRLYEQLGEIRNNIRGSSDNGTFLPPETDDGGDEYDY